MTDAVLLTTVVALPLLGALLSLVANARLQMALALGVESATLGVALTLIARTLAAGQLDAFAHWFYLDSLSSVVMLVVAVVSAFAAIYSVGYLRHELQQRAVQASELRKYFFLLHLFVFAMLLVTISGNLGLLWTAISATTVLPVPGPPAMVVTPRWGDRIASSCSFWMAAVSEAALAAVARARAFRRSCSRCSRRVRYIDLRVFALRRRM